jgi:hypothetical protein
MHNFKDLTGRQFGRLRIIRRAADHICPSQAVRRWDCVCDCGKKIAVIAASLTSGKTKSCGCLHREMGYTNRSNTPGYSKKALQCWSQMKARCANPKHRSFKYYGGRGITVCARWIGSNGLTNFLADMGERPTGLSIDRINNNGNYEPGNCRWATWKEQSNNKSNSRRTKAEGRAS